uniref:Plastid lipid-associated protein/fibrillin conserved domain-containing protein n=1 Tax=Pseudo-nitzschia australis TaxID=44445 RepID=A0A7S4A9E2_9STRA|mmetsp:Transcript_10542/g.22413  ORF Transcript_10542/g.22413 Transcript_10542/m.22413 type:complete len:313 (-) Transcript_10542:96-1034(-)
MMVNETIRRCSTLLVLVLVAHTSAWAFSPQFDNGRSTTPAGAVTSMAMANSEDLCPASYLTTGSANSSRRNWLHGMIVTATSSALISSPVAAGAEDVVASVVEAAPAPTPLEMKEFVDPAGLFSLRVPTGFYTLRRTQKGDLPDAKTGKGRRGSSIFTAGNMAKAEVIAVERFPTRVLLEENGIAATGDLSTFPGIGDAKAVASLIILRREKDSPKNVGAKTLEAVEVTPDGKTLTFRLKTEIDVQKPELLLEEIGISRLFRVTVAKATLDSSDGNIMAIFASALEQDFTNGVDGPGLEDSVNSFQATNQSS